MDKHVLLIGRNPTVLTQLAAALTAEGFTVKTTSAIEMANQDFDGADFDLVAFGRGVDEATNARLRVGFLAQNSTILFVDGLAPVIPLLVKQIKIALSEDNQEELLTAFSCLNDDCSQVQVTLANSGQLLIDLYELDAVHTTYQQTLVNELVSAGIHRFSLDINKGNKATIKFLAAEANDRDLKVLSLSTT